MAKKRQVSQIDDPPTPAPKDDPPPSPETPVEDKVKADEEEDDDSTSSGEDSSSEGEEDEDEEDKNKKTPSTQPAPKNAPPPSSISKPKSPPSSEGESESESDSEPISKSKPLPSKSSKSQPQSSAAAVKSGTKRLVDNDTKPSSKKKKTMSADEVKEPEEDNKKSKLFQRVFNDEDEIAILKGAIDFIDYTGNDPFKYVTVFYEKVKKDIHVTITLEQLRDKMRRLKAKFEHKMKNVKNGKEPTFKKPIEEKMFEHCQKIWRDKILVNVAEEKGKPNGKSIKKEPATKKQSIVEKDHPGVNLILNGMVRFDKCVGLGPNFDVMKRELELLEQSEREEMEARWKQLRIAELKLFVKRAELVEDTTRYILDALKSSSSH